MKATIETLTKGPHGWYAHLQLNDPEDNAHQWLNIPLTQQQALETSPGDEWEITAEPVPTEAQRVEEGNRKLAEMEPEKSDFECTPEELAKRYPIEHNVYDFCSDISPRFSICTRKIHHSGNHVCHTIKGRAADVWPQTDIPALSNAVLSGDVGNIANILYGKKGLDNKKPQE